MKIKNYTSEQNPETSIANIEKYLVSAGATDISKNYTNGVCSAIRFRIVANGIPVFFQLPAKVESCYKILLKDKTYRSDKIKEVTMKQAERTAWKLISEWVQIQLSMIKLDQADVIEIFLPYVYNPATNSTFYNQLKDGGFKQLTNGQ